MVAAGPGRLERTIVIAAVFLALFPTWRHPALFFTLSDFLFCVGLLLLIARRGLPGAPFGVLTPFWYLCCALFVAGLVASSLIGGEPERGLIVPAQYLFAYLVLPFLLMEPDRAATVTLIKTFVFGVVFVNVFSMFLYYIDYKGGVPFITADYVTGSGRLGAFLEDPNKNSALIALTCPFLLYLWFSGALRIYYALPALVALMAALIMASSVGGLLASVLSVLVFLLASGSLRVLFQAILGLAACGAIVFIWANQELPSVFEARVLGAVRSGDIGQAGTFSERWELMEEAWGMVDQTLLFGVGADQYRVISAHGMPVHNVYLLVWAEGGLPALLGWLGLLATAFVSAAYVYRATPHRLIGGLGFAIALVFAFVGMSNAHMYDRSWAIPLELALALVVAALSERQPDADEFRAPPPAASRRRLVS